MEQRSNTLKGVRNAGTCVSPMAEGENSLNCTRKRKSRILIVEDSPTQAQTLRFLLVGAGFEVEVASDGHKGLDFFIASNLDLVISDVLMPGLSGYELCRRIKEHPKGKHVPVILLTKLKEPGDIIQGLECGADDFVPKPCQERLLIDRIDNLLSKQTLPQNGDLMEVIEARFLGKDVTITSDKQPILNLLLATFEEMSRTNQELKASQAELAKAKAEIEQHAEHLEGQVVSSEERYRLVVDSSQDAIYGTTLAGIITSWNAGAERLYGYSRQEIIGEPIFRLIPADRQEEAQRTLEKIRQGESVPLYETVRQRKDGTLIDISIGISPVKTSDGRILGTSVIVRDVSERKRAEDLLRESESRLHAVFENMSEGVVISDLDGHIFYWNRAALEMHDFTSSEEVKRHLSKFIDLFELSTLDGRIMKFEEWPMARLLRGEPLSNYELSVRRLDKEWRRLLSYGGSIVQDASGRKIAFLTVSDITERKTAEQKVRENEERFRLLVEGVKDHAIFMLDPSGNVVTWNTGAEQILGYKAEEIIGLNYSCYFPAEDVASGKPQRELEQAAAEGSLHEVGWRVRKDGSRFWSNGVLTALYTESGELRGFAKITRDLTERHRLEERLKQLAAIVQSSDDAIVGMSLDGIIQSWNPAAERLYGYSATEAVGQPFSMLVLDERVGSLVDRLARIAKGEQTEPYETVRVKKDRTKINVAARFSPVRDSNGSVIGVSAISRDISERKKLDEALRASEARNRQIVETATEGIWTIDAKAETTFVNRRMADMLGYTAEEMMGRSLFSLLHERDRGQALQRLEQLRQGAVAPFDMVLHRKDGTEVVTIVSAARFLDEEGRFVGALAMITDLSERKKLEEQLRQSQKMEAIGQLAGGVAHDFNNLLTIINGFSEMVAMKLRSDDPNRKMLQEVTKAGERAASLTRQLLAFSRKQVLEPRVLDLNAVVTDIEKMLQRLIGEDMVMTTVLAPGLRQVNVDPGQIEQIVMNLAVNARDAMPTGGKLTIETKNVDLDETYTVSRPEVIPGRYVMLAVSDTGCGMTPEIQTHIFEPFFTTKGPGKGTGLGLATVYGIVKQSGGYIYLYSEPGRGTAFKIYLPAVEKRESEKSLHGVKLMPHGTETILLVEDEDAVRAVSRFALQTFGYNVLEANRPTEAIRLCEQHQGPIALLVTDIVMPGMGGRALTERISELRPGIKVLYVSGYTDDAVVRHGVLRADVAFLQKPFTPTSLANKVRQVLDQTLPVGLTPHKT